VLLLFINFFVSYKLHLTHDILSFFPKSRTPIFSFIPTVFDCNFFVEEEIHFRLHDFLLSLFFIESKEELFGVVRHFWN